MNEQTPAKSKDRWLWYSAAGVVLLLLIGVAIWFFAGHRIWTDGGTIRISDRQAVVRQVIWTAPIPLEGFSSDEQVYEPSFSPDGSELYFVRGKAGRQSKIYVSVRRNNAWSKPQTVDAVNGPFDSLGPRLTPDGQHLLFYSDRPGGFGGYDIWASPRTESGWGQPFNLGPSVNSEFNEFNPDPTPDGRHLIFATNRKAAKREQNEAWRSTIRETVSSDYDLWIADTDASASPILPTTVPASPKTQPATQPAALPSLAFRGAHEIKGVNTEFTEGASCMSPANDFLYFASNRPGGLGKFDIYRARLHGSEFGPVENVGVPINSADNEADPALTYNGFRMVFSSDRPGADGRYRLLISDSREVYPERQGRALPHLGWSWSLLIISALVLVPLLMFLRGWDDRRLGILQKCLLLSLLVHALITFILSFVVVTQKITQYVKQESHLEVAVQLSQNQGLEESLSIRSQTSGDLPVSGAPAIPSSPVPVVAQSPRESAPPVDLPDVNIPATPAAASSGLVIAVKSPKVNDVPLTSPPADIKPVEAKSDLIEVKLPVSQTLAQSEATPKAAMENFAPAKIDAPANALPALPKEQTLTAPSARPSVSGDIAQAPSTIQPAIPPNSAGTVAAGTISLPQQVSVATPHSSGAKLTAAEQSAAASGEIATPQNPVPRQEANFAPASGGMLASSAPIAPSAASTTIADSGVSAHVQLPKAEGSATEQPGASMSAVQEPSVQIAANSARASAPEAAIRPGSAAEAPSTPAQSSASAGPAAAGPEPINLAAGPVKTSASPTDLAMASLRGGPIPAGNAGSNIGVGPAPAANTGATAIGPQVSLPAGNASVPKQANALPLLASAGGGPAGPATRPSETTNPGSAAGNISVAAAGPTASPKAFSDLAPVAGASRKSNEIAGATAQIQPNVPIGGSSIPTDLAAPTGVVAKLSSKSQDARPSDGMNAVAMVRESTGSPDAGGSPRIVQSGPEPIASSSSSQSLGADPFGVSAHTVSTKTSSVAPRANFSGSASLDLGSPIVGSPGGTVAASGPEKSIGAEAVAGKVQPSKIDASRSSLPGAVDVAAAPVMASAELNRAGHSQNGPEQAKLSQGPMTSSSSISPDVSLDPLGGSLGPGKLIAPDSPFMRSPQQRKPLLEKLGGTPESEDAVALGLAYLARVQEEDGRWSRIEGDHIQRHKNRAQHDMACTGFAVLAFLGQDHRPDKPGPYRDVVAHAVDYLISQQDDDGDLRGPRNLRGGGSDASNMYDQGIATYALAECGIMTHDPRIIAAANKAAQFIVDAQDPGSGGWRYSPKEPGDSSVFGWQIMALHSAEQIGFEIPPQTLENAKRYLQSCEEGKQGALFGYQPHNGPTPPMTAELLFSKMLLGMPLNDDGINEAVRYLSNEPPDARRADLYYWYYASLSMLNMQDSHWKQWNTMTRAALISLQQKDGPAAGSWDGNIRWADRGGRVFTTAMATLTLEVYYRYLPLRKPGVN